jgi:selenide, water dikinase
VGTGAPPVQAEQSSAASATANDKANAQRPTPSDAFAIHALTDITGFGLIGHAREMALASNVSLVIQSASIPVLEGALDCIRAGHIPGGLIANRDFAECLVDYDPSVPADIRTLVFDPQTAGGLLISVSPEDAPALTCALLDAGVPAVEIGEALHPSKPLITVR